MEKIEKKSARVFGRILRVRPLAVREREMSENTGQQRIIEILKSAYHHVIIPFYQFSIKYMENRV